MSNGHMHFTCFLFLKDRYIKLSIFTHKQSIEQVFFFKSSNRSARLVDCVPVFVTLEFSVS